jgi:hypothetical protein
MRTPARPILPPKTPKSRQASKENLVKDPVQVFCRIRPMQSEADLSCINARLTRLERKDTDIEICSRASSDVTTLCGLDEDNRFAVFITYVEIYNNSVYDFLCRSFFFLFSLVSIVKSFVWKKSMNFC